jgi:hypothetical protein
VLALVSLRARGSFALLLSLSLSVKAWQIKVHSGDSFAGYSDTEEVVYRSGSEIDWRVQ